MFVSTAFVLITNALAAPVPVPTVNPAWAEQSSVAIDRLIRALATGDVGSDADWARARHALAALAPRVDTLATEHFVRRWRPTAGQRIDALADDVVRRLSVVGPGERVPSEAIESLIGAHLIAARAIGRPRFLWEVRALAAAVATGGSMLLATAPDATFGDRLLVVEGFGLAFAVVMSAVLRESSLRFDRAFASPAYAPRRVTARLLDRFWARVEAGLANAGRSNIAPLWARAEDVAAACEGQLGGLFRLASP